jgi:hypothetical protein
MFDDRFARQKRFGPPPEFPLASTYTSIVHHLSGPNMGALASPRLKVIGRAGGAFNPYNCNAVFHKIPPQCAQVTSLLSLRL